MNKIAMSVSNNDTKVMDYYQFKQRYLAQFSSATLSFMAELETKESWSIDVNIEQLIETFNKLPTVCEHPLKENHLTLVVKLVRLLAYLPFKESITALAWLGFENEEYGYTIYKVAYDTYDDGSNDYANAHTIVRRTQVMSRIAMIQQILGRKA
ncbi:hypothetical protein [Vibrio harveyi]|uniref:hypothetical protein n=1 Tax=Vibrio harveyi TaxID=669 RepID=UPI0024805974|nr:hypothetical protein [Vibrio harveyi]